MLDLTFQIKPASYCMYCFLVHGFKAKLALLFLICRVFQGLCLLMTLYRQKGYILCTGQLTSGQGLTTFRKLRCSGQDAAIWNGSTSLCVLLCGEKGSPSLIGEVYSSVEVQRGDRWKTSKASELKMSLILSAWLKTKQDKKQTKKPNTISTLLSSTGPNSRSLTFFHT